MTDQQQIELMNAAAAECLSPEQGNSFDQIGFGNPNDETYARLYRCVAKRVPYSEAAFNRIRSILGCEIECSIFEKHVLPALEIVKKVEKYSPSQDSDGEVIAWMVKGNFTDFFTDLEEASKYAMTVRAEVIPLCVKRI